MFISTIIEVLDAKVISKTSNDLSIKYLSIDSRSVIPNESSLFFAIKGLRHDGHQYVEELIARGVKNFLIDDDSCLNHLNLKNNSAVNILLTKNVTESLQTIAGYKRNQFQYPVLAITGSNGKTITKEWLSTLLSNEYTVVKSPKSYNSQYGVPLSVWQMSEKDTFAVIEAGISQPSEMSNLQEVIQPTIGILTNIGTAHDVGFENHQEKLKEKLKLFSNVDHLFYNGDDPMIIEALKNRTEGISCGFKSGNQYRFQYDEVNKTLSLTTSKGEKHNYQPLYSDQASLQNLSFCLAVCHHLGITNEQLRLSITKLHQVSMRLELKDGLNDCYLIDDTYNNDFEGFRQALDFLGQQSQKEDKSLIMSDIQQAGKDQKALYESIGHLIEAAQLKNIVFIGSELKKHESILPKKAVFFETTRSYLKSEHWRNFDKEAILIKGARLFHFEKIIQRLQQKEHGTIMEVDLNAMIQNLNYFKGKLKQDTSILVMIKAYAYGSGFLEVANMLQNQRVDYLGVAFPDEGVLLRRNGITLPIMVMNAHQGSFDNLWRHKLEPEVYSLDMVEKLAEKSKIMDTSLRVHIKIETGMNRLGFEFEELEQLAKTLYKYPKLEIASIFSHMASADLPEHDAFNFKQIEIFNKAYDFLSQALKIKPIRHILKTSGILRFPNQQMEMVRLGIGLHGYSHHESFTRELTPAATLRTSISMIKNLKKGDAVGYNRVGLIKEDSRIATLRLGYADGYDRRFSDGVGKVLINGKLAPVVGNVCMDMCMVDVTDIECTIGDTVEIFGKNLSLIDVASSIGSIPYEILCKISPRVKRVFYSEI